jgi:hypothetical protein
MRRTEGPFAPVLGLEAIGRERLHRRGFKRFIVTHGRQQSRQSPGEHGFAGAGGTDHQQTVAPSSSDFECAPRKRLTPYLGQIVRNGP